LGTGIFGGLASITDVNGNATSFSYDALGRLVHTVLPDGSWDTWSYEHFGVAGVQHVRHETSAGLTNWSYFDGLGRTWQQTGTGPSGRTLVKFLEYDEAGRVRRRSLPSFAGMNTLGWTSYTYDALGRILVERLWDGRTIQSCWAPGASATIDTSGHLHRHFTDSRGNLIRVEEYLGSYTACDETALGTPSPYATTTYSYDPQGNLVRAQDARGNVTTLTYDGLGQKRTLTDPDLGTLRYQYEDDGSLAVLEDARHRQVFLAYDILGRLVQKDFDSKKPLGQGDVRFLYDGPASANSIGRLISVRYRKGSDRFTYDARGRVASEDRTIDGLTRRKQLEHDGLGRLTKVSYQPGETIEYRYDGPVLEKVLLGGAEIAKYGDYNELLQAAWLRLGNGLTERYAYSRAGDAAACDQGSLRPCDLRLEAGDGSTLLRENIQYDPVGNVVTLDRSDLGVRRFSYDEIGRLTKVLRSSSGVPTTTEFEATYDQIGNFIRTSTLGAYRYHPGKPHAVVAAGSRTIRYDASGNVIRSGNVRMDYDAEEHLIDVRDATGTRTQLFYDGDGARVEKIAAIIGHDAHGNQIISGEQVRYFGEDLVCTGGTSCTLFVVVQGRKLAAKTGLSLFFIHADVGGTQVGVSNSQGTLLGSYRGLGFGAPEGVLAPLFAGDSHRFAGQEWDSSSALYFAGTRYYDPQLGRYLSPDSGIPSMLDPQLLNRYAYAANNPYTLSDPDGQFPIAIIIGAVIGAIVAGSSSDWDPQAVFLGAVIGGASAGVGAWAAGAVAGGSTVAGTGVLASMAGGAASGGTSALLYRAAGYDVDFMQAVGTGAVTAGFGSVAAEAIGFPGAGGAFSGGLSSAIAGEDVGQGALQGFLTESASSIGEGIVDESPAFTQADADAPTADNPKQGAIRGDIIAYRSSADDVGNQLWSYGLGDGYSHVLLALGNGQFAEITPGRTVGITTDVGTRYAGRQFIKGHIDLDAGVNARIAAIKSTYFKPYVCTTYVNAVTGRTWGLTPGIVARGPLLRSSYGFYRTRRP
jgi:RHS repeat-associated protein